MVQIPIVNGIYADVSPDFRVAYPVNFLAVPRATGISDGYLRPSDGIVELGVSPGGDTLSLDFITPSYSAYSPPPGIGRGGIVWNGEAYRVMGTKLVSVAADGTVTVLGDVGSGGQCRFDYSFDRLAITSGGRLYYWNGSALVEVTDPDLGTALTVVWIDGYFMTTDGEFLVVTELTDPTQVNPLKYGSSEIDPDPVVSLLKLRNEIYAINRNTIEVFDNVGGELFPFQRNEGAQIPKGCVGTNACCVFVETIAFLGSGRNEAPGIYVGANANAQKISTQEIDELLLGYSEAELAEVIMEARNDRSHQLLYVHLQDRCLVYDAGATGALGQPVWTVLTSTLNGFAQYRARDMLYVYDGWQVIDPASPAIGVLSRDVSSHWGDKVRWEFGTQVVYNNGAGGIMSSLELVALTGSVAMGTTPTISTSYTVDGVNWSQDRALHVGGLGQRAKRLVWFRQGSMRHWRIQRFRGTSDAHMAVARLEAAIEPLAW